MRQMRKLPYYHQFASRRRTSTAIESGGAV